MPVLDALSGANENSAIATTTTDNNNNNNNSINWCSRFRAELRQFSWNGIFFDGACCRRHDGPSTFDIQDPGTDRIIDIPSSFFPTGTLVLLWKSTVMVFIASVMTNGIIIDIRHGRIGRYLSFFSNWGTLASFFYMSMSFINSAFAKWDIVRQPDNRSHGGQQYPNLWIRTTWALFAIATHAELSISLIFWVHFAFVDSTHKWAQGDVNLVLRNYQDVMTHGVIGILILIDGFVANRIPLRLAHGWQFSIWFYVIYMVWMPIDAHFVTGPVFYLRHMTRDMSGRLAPSQEPSPRFIYATFALHAITGVLFLCYGFVVNSRNSRKLPSWLSSFGMFVLCCDLVALIWPGVYEVFGKELEYCLGKMMMGLIIVAVWCPMMQIILFFLSGMSRKRYLLVNAIPNVEDGLHH